jgi:hypothetical protein
MAIESEEIERIANEFYKATRLGSGVLNVGPGSGAHTS